jgi:hypothetical protein
VNFLNILFPENFDTLTSYAFVSTFTTPKALFGSSAIFSTHTLNDYLT